MHKLIRFSLLLVLLAGSSFNILETISPAPPHAYNVEKTKSDHSESIGWEIGNDEIITNEKNANHSKKIVRQYPRLSHPYFLNLSEAVTIKLRSGKISHTRKQLPGYGNLFLYQLF